MSPRYYDLSEAVVPGQGAEAIADTPSPESPTSTTEGERNTDKTDVTSLDSNSETEDQARQPDERTDVTNLASRRTQAKKNTPVPKLSSTEFSDVLKNVDRIATANPTEDFGKVVVSGVREYAYRANKNALNVLSAVVPTLLNSGNFDETDRASLTTLHKQITAQRKEADSNTDPTAMTGVPSGGSAGGSQTLPAADPNGGGGAMSAPSPSSPDGSSVMSAPSPTPPPAPAGGGDSSGGGGGSMTLPATDPNASADPTQQTTSRRHAEYNSAGGGESGGNGAADPTQAIPSTSDIGLDAGNPPADPSKSPQLASVAQAVLSGVIAYDQLSKDVQQKLAANPFAAPPQAAPQADPMAGGGGCGHEYPWNTNADGSPLTCTEHDPQSGFHQTNKADGSGQKVNWPPETPDARGGAAKASSTKTADDNLDAAKENTESKDVEKPVNDTSDRAQQGQYDRGEFDQNGPTLTDPDESTDQNWPPKSSAVDAIRLADVYVDLGLIQPEQKYQVVAGFENMNAYIVKDRLKVLTAVAEKVKTAPAPQRNRALVPQSSNGQSTGKLPQMGRGSALNGNHSNNPDVDIHFLAL